MKSRAVVHAFGIFRIFGMFGISLVVTAGCDKLPGKKKVDKDEPAPPPVVASTETVPPAAPFNATPVAQFADAGTLEGKSPLEQARAYEANGQLWMARLVLEPKALGAEGTKEEAETLLRICIAQSDAPCVEACGIRVGRRVKIDAGAPAVASAAHAGGEHREPDTELAHARDLVLKNKLDPARKLLEPKVLDGRATPEETRLLRTVCQKQGDRMCIALCDTKLR